MKIGFVNDCVERLGVEYISAVLKKNKHKVQLFIDPQLFNDVYIQINSLRRYFDFIKNIINNLIKYAPELIGFSVDTESYQWACQIAAMIKQEMDVPIIFGGIHPTSVPERVINNDFVDMVCVGEGEYPMLELVNSMQRGQIDYSIKNIWFKKNGQVIRNKVRSLIEDLDSLPTPDKELYYSASPYLQKVYGIITMRGCTHACSYCVHAYLRQLYQSKGLYCRHRQVENVIRELTDGLNKYKFKAVGFFDDNFGFNLQWLEKFSVQYSKIVQKPFAVTTHPEMVSRDYVQLLKQAGCCSVTLGIQTWDSIIRKEWFNREVSHEVMYKAIKLIKEAQLELICDNIFDIPHQNIESYIQSLLPYADAKPNRILFNQLKYFPKTPITKKAKTEKFISLERYNLIMEGKSQRGVFLGPNKGSMRTYRDLIKAKFFLYSMDCLPKAWIQYSINKRLYRFLPTFIDPAFVIIFRMLFSVDTDTQHFKDRIVAHYKHYIIWRLRKFWLKRVKVKL